MVTDLPSCRRKTGADSLLPTKITDVLFSLDCPLPQVDFEFNRIRELPALNRALGFLSNTAKQAYRGRVIALLRSSIQIQLNDLAFPMSRARRAPPGGCQDLGTVRIWELRGRTLRVLPHGVDVQVAEYAPYGISIATSAAAGRLRPRDAATGKLRAVIDAHRARITARIWDPQTSR